MPRDTHICHMVREHSHPSNSTTGAAFPVGVDCGSPIVSRVCQLGFLLGSKKLEPKREGGHSFKILGAQSTRAYAVHDSMAKGVELGVVVVPVEDLFRGHDRASRDFSSGTGGLQGWIFTTGLAPASTKLDTSPTGLCATPADVAPSSEEPAVIAVAVKLGGIAVCLLGLTTGLFLLGAHVEFIEPVHHLTKLL